MATYSTSIPPTGDECRVNRTVNLGNLTIAFVSVTGGGGTTIGTGPGTTDPSGTAAQRFTVSLG